MRKRPLLSLSVKAGLVLFLVVAGALAIVYAAVVPQLEDRLVEQKTRELEAAVPLVAQELGGLEPFVRASTVVGRAESLGMRIIVFQKLTEDQLLNQVDSLQENRPGDLSEDPVALEAVTSGTAASGRVERGGASYTEAAFPLNENEVVLVSVPLDDVLANSRVIKRTLLVAGGVALAISWLVGYLIAWLFTRRIRRLESAAERLAEGDFETPIRDSGRDEVGQLAEAFDSMRSRLAVLDRARGEFIANASHELRTPLFSLGGFVELLGDEGMDPAVRRDFLAEMRDQIDRLTRLATDLLDLSRLDAGQLEVETASFDLCAAARLVADEFRAVAESSGRELTLDGDADLYALGDDVRVQQIARVFVENAIRHTPPGTPIALSVEERDGRAVLEVVDGGPGIPEEDQEHLFQRFYRAAGGKASGSGLGLAIASELATRMDATIEVMSVPGRTVFTLKLPLDPERSFSCEVEVAEPVSS
ncbi:MAG TPA: HAMP domain-containing sensor histidine kinase [Gaiellaceae bacterium]|nr:HAMP domain-containing sensor histidine kinase [Gaiellaceae bacterium]